MIYRIDIEAIEQFVNQHLKEKLRQLKLSDIKLKQNSIEEEVKAEKN
jgi:demethoxyubiquinone hydroxylase (CLK1/Coq7/Cat5 family)